MGLTVKTETLPMVKSAWCWAFSKCLINGIIIINNGRDTGNRCHKVEPLKVMRKRLVPFYNIIISKSSSPTSRGSIH